MTEYADRSRTRPVFFSITALAFSPSEAVALDWAAGSAVIQVLGKWAFLLLIIALCAAVWSGINGFMICSSKLLGSIAKYGLVPSSIGNINNSGVFNNSIKFVTIVSLVAPWFGRDHHDGAQGLGAGRVGYAGLLNDPIRRSRTFRVASPLCVYPLLIFSKVPQGYFS